MPISLTVYPAEGETVLDADGDAVPTTGLVVTLSGYYLELIRSGDLLTYNPLTSVVETAETLAGSQSLALLVTNLTTRVGVFDRATVLCDGHTTALDGGGGHYTWYEGSATAADGYIVVGTTNEGRWKRSNIKTIESTWYIPDSSGVVDATTKLQLALNAVPEGGTFHLAQGTYLITSTLSRTSSITITGTGTLKRSGSWTGPLLSIHGASTGSRADFAYVRGIRFDGNDSGTISYASDNAELKIYYVKMARVFRCHFQNTRCYSLVATYCDDFSFRSCRFLNGAPSGAPASATTTVYASAFFITTLDVDGNTFQSDITYDAGDRTQEGALVAAPTNLLVTNCENITCSNNKSYSSGNFEFYEANRNITVIGNHFEGNHLPAIKVQNANRLVCTGNVINDPVHWWGSGIMAACYSRLTTYGCLRPDQGHFTIQGNVINGCKADYGPIFVQGTAYSTTDLDTRIAAQGSYGYTTTNIVVKTGSNYAYTDFDGTVHPNIDQTYLLARNVQIANNVIDGFATTGVYTYLCDSAQIQGNTVSNAASLDTQIGFTKALIKALDCNQVDISGNVSNMLSTTNPTISAVNSFMHGIMATSSATAFVRTMRAKINNNTICLGKVSYTVYVEDLEYASIQNNEFNILSFYNASSTFIRSAGCNDYGIIAGNRYKLDDITNAPSASNEYSAVQTWFMSCQYLDDRHGVETTRRVIASSADYTTPTQVASGYYTIGSTITVTGNQHSTYYRCSTAGYLAPVYDAGTTYSKGHKVKSAENNYFVALQSTTGNLPPVTLVDDTYWRALTATAAVFATMTL